jgi:predicted AAA+ superfamily ATPase
VLSDRPGVPCRFLVLGSALPGLLRQSSETLAGRIAHDPLGGLSCANGPRQLSGALVVRQLQPWFENIGKRQVKAPKVYVADSGLLRGLLNLARLSDIEGHPKAGSSWEGFVIEQVITLLRAEPEECFFWATHAGAELDLLLVRDGQRRGFEIKRTSSPRVTRSMRVAMQDLRLSNIDVIHAGHATFELAPRIRAVAMTRLLTDIRPLQTTPSRQHWPRIDGHAP